MQKNPRSVNIDTDQEEVALLFQQYGLVNMTVTDVANRLLGVILVDDIVDVINEAVSYTHLTLPTILLV